MAQIREICRQHDIGGYFVIVSPTHAEFGFEIHTPSFSCVQWEERGLRFRTKGFDAETQKRKAEGTVHMLDSIRQCCTNAAMSMGSAIGTLRKSMTILAVNKIGVEPDHVEPYPK